MPRIIRRRPALLAAVPAGVALAVLHSVTPADAAVLAAADSGNESLFTKVGDFASENATWFIIGLIAIAVILAAFFIIRAGRKGEKQVPSAGKSAPPGATAPAGKRTGAAGAGQVSASEMKRRRRAAMQRAREEERLRRKGVSSRQRPQGAPLDPVEAEKAAAKGQARQPVAEPPVPPVSSEAPTAVSSPVASGAAGAVAAGAAAGAMAGRVESPDAEERLREKVEQMKAGQSGVPPQPTRVSGLGEVAPDLAEAELRLQSDRAARDEALGQAELRLRELEARAEAAERRAAFAEQLANLRAEEGEHERRLNEVLSRIDRAEHRAQMAEIRAEEAERTASEALRGGGVGPATTGTGQVTSAPLPQTPAPAGQPPAPTPARPQTPANPVAPGGVVNINTAGFEELRSVDLSVTQATRVMAYRERFGGYGSVEDLARVPGFSPDVIEALRGRITA